MIKSTVMTTSGVVENVSCTLHTVNVTKPATGSGTIDIYDNKSAASGNKVFSGDGLAEMSYPLGNFAGGGVICSQGIYVNLGGSTNATVVVTYE
jgi:hypothetical protein